MKQILLVILVLFLLPAGCMIAENKDSTKAILFKYPTPFYLLNKNAETQIIYGIKTNRFIYIEQEGKPWLLYDKYVDSTLNINMLNTDEYTFIQLDLKRQLNELIEKSDISAFLRNYSFYSIDSLLIVR